MELELKPNMKETLARFDAWWRCEVLDRPPVSVPVISDHLVAGPAKQHANLRERWFDVEYWVDAYEAWMTGGMWLGDSIPTVMPNLGPEICATLFGGELEFSDYTSWSIPCIKSCRDMLDMEPNFENEYWRTIRELTERSLERGQGRWLTGVADLHMDADLLAALRDPQELCLELAMDPEGVRLACEHVTRFFPSVFDDIYQRIAGMGQPLTSWIPCPYQGRMGVTQCDFICMISPEMFQTAILPSLREEFRYLDRTIFHLDGPGALCHLDALLECRDLQGVQWVCGAGNGSGRDWVDVYQRIQKGHKCMQVMIDEDLDEGRELMSRLRPEGVWFHSYKAFARADVERFIADVERWSRRGGKRVG